MFEGWNKIEQVKYIPILSKTHIFKIPDICWNNYKKVRQSEDNYITTQDIILEKV